ncbi:hypothetical protein BJ138DRAFT_1163869 [Hygrophoropsis aurantiaca]|uniref:Uncharacterized protein n=1 Tax=Hygrophoropsis aurantiaca TaxID=72124 RepID=A0ACB7ZY60_9AGAM|nr:hypothetical protein BJ138DRAFT_1163869 [Hygrophoropsis aurantiaca]
MSQFYEWLRNGYWGYTIPLDVLSGRLADMGYDIEEDNDVEEHRLPPERREQRRLAINATLRKMLIDANLYFKPAKAVLVKLKDEYDEKKKKMSKNQYCWMIAMAYKGACDEGLLPMTKPPNDVWTDLRRLIGLDEGEAPRWGVGPLTPCVPYGMDEGHRTKRNQYWGYAIPLDILCGRLAGMGYDIEEDNDVEEHRLPPERREQRRLAINAALRKMLFDANLYLKPAKAVLVKVKDEYDEKKKKMRKNQYCWMIAMAYKGPCKERLLLEKIPPDEVWTDLRRLIGLDDEGKPEWGKGRPVPPFLPEHDF